MSHTALRAAATLCLACTAWGATPALAAEGESAWTVPVSLSLVSDYLFRGQTQTCG